MDIVERLRRQEKSKYLMMEAANEIERLRSVLLKIKNARTVFDGGSIQECRNIASRGLNVE